MSNIIYIISKEFKQIFRNKAMLPIIFLMPIVQLLILANAATFELKNIKGYIIDNDKTTVSRQIINKLLYSKYFILTGFSDNLQDGEKALLSSTADFYVSIPQNFENNIVKGNQDELLIVLNSIDGTKAMLAMAYLSAILVEFNQELLFRNSIKMIIKDQQNYSTNDIKKINLTFTHWYNNELDYKTFMVPGLIVLLVTLIGTFLSAMNIAREKEFGTIEQLNVTPIKKHQFIIGKLVPFWIIAMFELAFGLFIAYFFYRINFLGNILVIFTFASVFLVAMLGIGLFISTIAKSQQQSMFISWFFAVLFVLLSGFFSPIENMPEWIQFIAFFNPIRYFIEVNRLVLLKGAGLAEIQNHFIIISAFAIIINTLAVLRYKKTN